MVQGLQLTTILSVFPSISDSWLSELDFPAFYPAEVSLPYLQSTLLVAKLRYVFFLIRVLSFFPWRKSL